MSGTAGDREKDFFEAVGRTLFAWQRVEGRLMGIYLQLLGGPNAWGAAGAAFYSVFSLKGKLKMIQEAAKWGLAEFPLLSNELSRLLRKTGKRSKKRNDLVHLEASEGDTEWLIGPPLSDFSTIDRQYYNTADIVRWAEEFNELHDLLLDFSKRIPDDRARQRKRRR
jgi:hypothetical protein